MDKYNHRTPLSNTNVLFDNLNNHKSPVCCGIKSTMLAIVKLSLFTGKSRMLLYTILITNITYAYIYMNFIMQTGDIFY